MASSEILNYEAEHADDSTGNRTAQHFDPETQQWGSMPISAFGLEGFGDVEVSEVMTTELIWVARDTPLKEVACRMLDERVHRVLVMDANSHLLGVVSAFDFVRVIAEK